MRKSNSTGWILIACGMLFLILAVGGTLIPLSSISFGPLEASGLPDFSVLNAFIGIVLIAMGVVINSGRRPF